MVDFSIPVDIHAIEATLSAIFGSGATAALLTWKRFMQAKNSAKLEAAKTNAEVDVVEHLQEQRDFAMSEAKEAKRSQLRSDFENQTSKTKITALETELTNLRQRVQLLSQLVTRLTTALDLTRNQLNNIIQKTRSTKDQSANA